MAVQAVQAARVPKVASVDLFHAPCRRHQPWRGLIPAGAAEMVAMGVMAEAAVAVAVDPRLASGLRLREVTSLRCVQSLRRKIALQKRERESLGAVEAVVHRPMVPKALRFA